MPNTATVHAYDQCRSARLTNAIAASEQYATRPQKDVGKPSSVAQRLVRTRSHPPPAGHPRTAPPLKATHDRYPVKAMPRPLNARSGQLGAGRTAWTWGASFGARRFRDLVLMLAGHILPERLCDVSCNLWENAGWKVRARAGAPIGHAAAQ